MSSFRVTGSSFTKGYAGNKYAKKNEKNQDNGLKVIPQLKTNTSKISYDPDMVWAFFLD